MKKYIVEFIGTFFLVFTIGCTVVGNGAGMMAPLAIGAALMVMVFAGGHISGAHYNPAVTLGVWLRGRCDAADVLPYVLSQIIGATLAAMAVRYLKGNEISAMTVAIGPALLAEFLFTFALVFVILNVATAKGTSNNSFYGLAIGMTVMAGAYSVGKYLGRRVQSCGGGRRFDHGAFVVGEHLDLPFGGVCGGRGGGVYLFRGESRRQIGLAQKGIANEMRLAGG